MTWKSYTPSEKLSAPTVSITVKTDSGEPRLTWSAVSGAAKYEIWRATSKGGTYSKRYTTTGTRFTNSSAVTGHTYYYKVKAVCAKSSYGNSAFSGVKSIVCGRDTSDIIMSTADLDRLCAEANAYAESIGMKICTQKSGWVQATLYGWVTHPTVTLFITSKSKLTIITKV